MAQPSPTTTVTNPRIAKLIELEVAGRIKPQHQTELDTYRAQGLAPKKSSGNSLTEYQGKSTGYYERAFGADKDFSAAGEGGEPVGVAGDMARAVLPTNIVNSFTSPERQKAQQAKEDWIRASLRYESGAAIGKEEFEGQDRIFFPQTGDSEEVIKQKAAARQRVAESLKVAAGPGVNAAKPAASAPDPDAGKDRLSLLDAPAAALDVATGVRGGPLEVDVGGGTINAQTPEFRAGLDALLDSGAPYEKIKEYWDKNAPGALERGADPRPAPLATDRGENGIIENADAAVRGAADTITLGLASRGAALADTVSNGGTYRENLDRQRGVDEYDAMVNPWMRGVGQLSGALAIPTGAAGAGVRAEEAALTAGRSAQEARVASRYGIARRMGLEGGGIGAAYGFNSEYGDAGEKVSSAVKGLVGGAATGYGLGRLVGAIGARGDRPPEPPTKGQEVAAAAAEQGVEVMPADVGGPFVARVTQGAYQTPFGVQRIANKADSSVASLAGARNRIAGEAPIARDVGEAVQAVDEIGLNRATNAVRTGRDAVVSDLGAAQDITGAGQAGQRGANAFIERTGDRATDLYGRIPIAADLDAKVSSTRQQLAEMTKGMESNPQLAAMFANPKFKGYLDALTPKTVEVEGKLLPGGGRAPATSEQQGGKLNWSDLADFRTRVGDMLDDPRLSEGIAPRQLRALYGAISRDMETTARTEGPQAYRAWKRANDYYDGRQKRINGPLSLLLGTRKDATANEAYGQIERLARDAAGGDFAQFGQILRSLPPEDAQTIRATLVSRAGEGQAGFSAKDFAKAWGGISDRAKSYLVPKAGQRELMDEAANRALDIEARTPMTGKSGDAVFDAIEKMATSKGDDRRFQQLMSGLSPDDAANVRGRLIRRMGEPTAANKDNLGEGFSPKRFLTRWNEFTDDAKTTLFGKGDLRDSMEDLATIANGMNAAQKYANTSSSAGGISVDKTGGALGAAVVALLTGHPIIAAGLASPAAVQNMTARLMTSPRMVRWLVRSSKASTPAESKVQISRLSNIAVRDPTIRNEIAQLQDYLLGAVNDNANRVAASGSDEKDQAEAR